MMPIQHGPSDNSPFTTLLELHCNVKPDANTPFLFGALGFFCRENEGEVARTKFQSESHSGMALNRDRDSNSLIFWCPEVSRFNTSADCTIDENKDIKTLFSQLVHDGGLEIRPLHSGSAHPSPFTVGSPILFKPPGGKPMMSLPGPSLVSQHRNDNPNAKSNWMMVPPSTWMGPSLSIQPQQWGGSENCDCNQGDPLQSHSRKNRPDWFVANSKAVIKIDGHRVRGYPMPSDSGEWVIERRDQFGITIDTTRQSTFGATWQELKTEGTPTTGWNDVLGFGRQVSASNLKG